MPIELNPDVFRVRAVLDVGLKPHQVVFTADGGKAYVAASGSDRITRVDARRMAVTGAIDVPESPLGLFLLSGEREIAVTRFASNALARYDLSEGRRVAEVVTGAGPSLFSAPLPDGARVVAAERADRIWFVGGRRMDLLASIATGRRPFPPSATADGLTVFVPEHDDGTVAVFDLEAVAPPVRVPVGSSPTGGAVWPGGQLYAVAVRGENRLAFVRIARPEVAEVLEDGIGEGPLSVLVSPEERVAFVNNTGSADVSVIDTSTRRVISRVPVGEQPIAMAIHPDGRTLWVSCEGTDDVWVFEIPEVLR